MQETLSMRLHPVVAGCDVIPTDGFGAGVLCTEALHCGSKMKAQTLKHEGTRACILSCVDPECDFHFTTLAEGA